MKQRCTHTAWLLICLLATAGLSLFSGGCAQIGMPTGGLRDSLPPVLVRSTPELKKTGVTGNKITLYFNEYIDLKDVQSSLLISPVQKNTPNISSSLRSVTVRLRDTLLPNTTYFLQFGDAIRDVNEGNPVKDFHFVFSTGDKIDSLTLSGRVLMAETGKPDSTLMVLMYRDAPDSAVQTRKPDFAARVKGDGSFSFRYLPEANVKVYALKDGDGSKTYNSATEIFAFSDTVFNTKAIPGKVMLYAFAREKTSSKTTAPKTLPEKKLKYITSIQSGQQDILSDFTLEFNNKLVSFDSTLVSLRDTNYKIVSVQSITLDSTRKKLSVKMNWSADQNYVLILGNQAFRDTLGNTLPADSIRFHTRKTTDYGRVVLRFRNLDLARHPLLQFLQGDEVKFSAPVNAAEWRNDLVVPGEYELRIVYDSNRNGRWDPGDYPSRRQPELATALEQKLGVRADWDNERDIEL